jgi:FixJ family two-component response regulator
VLLDMGLPDGHGLEPVRRARAVAPDVPLIVLPGLDDEALAAEAMKEGAQDHLIKGQIENAHSACFAPYIGEPPAMSLADPRLSGAG